MAFKLVEFQSDLTLAVVHAHCLEDENNTNIGDSCVARWRKAGSKKKVERYEVKILGDEGMYS